MGDIEWVQCCADRLQQQWPRASREDLEETGRELHAQDIGESNPPQMLP